MKIATDGSANIVDIRSMFGSGRVPTNMETLFVYGRFYAKGPLPIVYPCA